MIKKTTQTLLNNSLTIDLTRSIEEYFSQTSMTSFTDLSEIISIARREILVTDIEEETGSCIDNIISLFNYIDDAYDVPVDARQPVKILIDSNGGSVTSALTICDAIKLSKTPVWTINIGKAYSAGFIIFTAGKKRISYPNATFLMHEGSIRTGGDANKFDDSAEFYKKLREKVKNLIVDSSDKFTEELYQNHRKDDWWFDTQEAFDYGFVDVIGKE